MTYVAGARQALTIHRFKLNLRYALKAEKLAAILLIAAIIIALLVFIFLSRPVIYHFNEEITTFPKQRGPSYNTSITFTGWSVKNKTGITDLLFVNFTVRNLDKTFIGLPLCVPEQAPELKYGGTHYTFSYYTDEENWSAWNFYVPLGWLYPNQHEEGFLVYEIIKGMQPDQLVYPKTSSATIIVEFR